MSKLSFRARALDPSKPMPIYLAEELPDLPEYSAINRAVPQMPSGMEKEEESEHHLQRAICTGLIIPTPEVYDSTDSEFYDKYYPPDYKLPKQLIHMQPLNLEQDIPDYDMDSADEVWVTSHEKKLDLDPLKFEIMMDRLEKSSGQTVVTLNEAKALLKQDDEVSIAVYDYWLNKRLKMQHPLILYVKTENRGNMTPNNPYLAFRRRTEKMQTRKNRKNDESSYEKMLKLRRDLSRAVTLLDMIKRREKLKREQLHLSIEIYEKRYQAQDFHGHLLSEFTSNATRVSRPAFAPIYSNQYAPLAGGQGVNAVGTGAGPYASSSQYGGAGGGGSSGTNKRDNESLSSRKEKRQYKKRKQKLQKDRGLSSGGAGSGSGGVPGGRGDGAGGSSSGSGLGNSASHHHLHPQQQLHYHGSMVGGIGGRGVDGTVSGGHGTDHHHHLHGTGDHAVSSDDEELANLQGTSPEEEYAYAFRRSKHSQYHRPRADGYGNWPWTSREENGSADPRFRFTLTSLRYPRPRCIGFARRRLGRGGRVIIDRIGTDFDDLWSRLDYTIVESETIASLTANEPAKSRDEQQKEDANNEPIVVPIGRRQMERTVSVSSNCSNTSSSAGVVVSLKPPRLLPGTTTAIAVNHHQHHQPLVNGTDEPGAATNGTPGTIVSRRKLILKQEHPALRDYESDGGEIQFLASIGLMNKAESQESAEGAAFASTKRRLRFDSEEKDEQGESVVAREQQQQSGVCDERTLSGVPNSDSIVIKSENDTEPLVSTVGGWGGSVVVKQEEPEVMEDHQKTGAASEGGVPMAEDFEQLIDSVNSRNNARNRFNVTTVAVSSNSISSTSNVERVTITTTSPTTATVGGQSQEQQQQTVGSFASRQQGPGGSPSRLHDATREDIDAVYKDLLNDIQSNWLHFRPKTPEPSQDDLLTLDGEDDLMEQCLGLTDRNRITLELQALDEQLPATIFSTTASSSSSSTKGSLGSSLFRTAPYALDNLIEPHPLSLDGEGDGSGAKAATTAGASTSSIEVKLETSGSSSGENNLSVPSELNLSLNESSEDNEKMLDNILQECAIDDPKQLHQTSNFWNGILDDGMLNSLDTGPKEEDEPMPEDPDTSESNLLAFSTAKIGYHSDLVGYGRPAGAADRRTSKSKRRKMLKRCSYLVGSSYFAVKSLPKEEIFQPLLDADGQPIVLGDGELLDALGPGGDQCDLQDVDEAMDADTAVGVEAMEIKMEEEASLAAAANELAETSTPMALGPGEQHVVKIEPPDELVASSERSEATLLGSTPTAVQFLPHNTTLVAPDGTTIKMEPFNHISSMAARSSTPDGAPAGRAVPTGSTTLIPATIVVSQPSSTGGNSSMFSTTGGSVPAVVSVALQQGGLHQLVHTSSAPSMAPGTTMLVMQSIPSNNSAGSVQSTPSASVAGTPTSFLLSTSGNTNAMGAASSIAGSILVQTSASSSLANAVQSSSASSPSTASLLSNSTPIVVTVPPASSSGMSSVTAGGGTQPMSVVMPTSGTNTVVSIAAPIVVSSASVSSLGQSIANAQSASIIGNSTVVSSNSVTSGVNTATALNSYIVQHNSTPIMISHQQMQQLANSGGANIMTVGGQQVVTTKQHHGETFVLTHATGKKQINGPSDGSKNATTSAVTMQNINHTKFHALLGQKLGAKANDSAHQKQLDFLRKAALVTTATGNNAAPKMIVKTANHGQQLLAVTAVSSAGGMTVHHPQSASQQQQQQQQQYNVIHQNSLNSPITIVSAQSSGQGQANKIILNSSHLLQQTGGVPLNHGKLQLTTVHQGQQQGAGAGGQVGTVNSDGQLVTLDPSGQGQGIGGVKQADKNRVSLYNIKGRTPMIVTNQKLLNLLPPAQQQKLANIAMQQTHQQLLLNQAGHGGSTTILSKGQMIQRVPVSIRTLTQSHQQQTNLADMVVVNNPNSIKFIQAAASAAAAAVAAGGGGGGNVVNNNSSSSTAGTLVTSRVNSITTSVASSTTMNASSDGGTGGGAGSSSGSGAGSSSSGSTSNCVQVATLSTSTANVNSSGGGTLANSSSSSTNSVASAATSTAVTAASGAAGGGSTTVVGNANSNGGAGGNASGGNTNSTASINITNR
uniref:Enhancer of polycomb-like protein n=1 Tax=Anopheles melas TaxID=34690 RepID=A0A182TMI9_9DIPT